MRTKKFLAIIFAVFSIAVLTVCFASAYDEYCEEYGHDLEVDWDYFWDNYKIDGSKYFEAYCYNCDEYFDGEVSVTKKVTKATFSSNGNIKGTAVAYVDGEKFTDSCTLQTIYKVTGLSVSKDTYNYTGSAINPSVTITDSKSKKISSSNYTLTYSNNKNVGTASIKITMKGNYSGSQSVTFKIVPTKPVISSVTAKSTSATVKWQKQTAQVDSFKLQYSTDKTFASGVKTINISDKNTTSKSVSGLTAGKTYYFRLSAVKKVNDKSYTATSSVKSVKTVAVISLSKTAVTMYRGKTYTLTAKVASGTVSWKSSNTSVAKVSSKGVITAVAKGSATITASVKSGSNTYKATCTVTVKSPSVSLNKTSATLYVGKVKKMYTGGSVTLKATTDPAGCTVTWSSSDKSIATVSSAGKVTAVKKGTAKITAKFTYAGYSYSKSCTVTVKTKAGITLKSVSELDDSYYTTEIYIEFVNNTNTKINSIKFETYLLDDDYYYVYCNGYKGQNLYHTNGVSAGATSDGYWGPMYTNSAVHGLNIEKAVITYSDGTTETVDISTNYWDACCHSHVTR